MFRRWISICLINDSIVSIMPGKSKCFFRLIFVLLPTVFCYCLIIVKKKGYNWSPARKGPKIIIGETRIAREFYGADGDTLELHHGVVVSRRRLGRHYVYTVEYRDGDTEELYAPEIERCMVFYNAPFSPIRITRVRSLY